VPVQFVVPGEFDKPPAQLGVDTVNFAHSDIWDLSATVSTTVTTVGASTSRRFPAVHLGASVKRRSSFVLLNAALPVSSICFLSLTTFFVPPEDTADRLELSVTILLTAVAFKYTTASYLPMISYMTLIDKFTLLCSFIIVIVCMCHTVLGMLDTWVEVPSGTLDFLNKVFCAVIALAWGGVQLWFLRRRSLVIHHKADANGDKDGVRHCDKIRW